MTLARVVYERAGCASLCPVDRLAVERDGSVTYDGYRNVTPLGHYLGRIDDATVTSAFARFDRLRDMAEATSNAGPDAERVTLVLSRIDGRGALATTRSTFVAADEARALDGLRAGARLRAASWEDPYLGFFARESGPDTLDVMTIEDASPGHPIAYGRTTRVDPCVPRGLSDRAVTRGRLVRAGASVGYAPERSEFDPVASVVGVRLTGDGLALRGDARERSYVRLSQAAYLARLDGFQARVDARHGTPCATQ